MSVLFQCITLQLIGLERWNTALNTVDQNTIILNIDRLTIRFRVNVRRRSLFSISVSLQSQPHCVWYSPSQAHDVFKNPWVCQNVVVLFWIKFVSSISFRFRILSPTWQYYGQTLAWNAKIIIMIWICGVYEPLYSLGTTENASLSGGMGTESKISFSSLKFLWLFLLNTK